MKVCPKCGKQYGDDANFCTTDAGRLVAMSAAPAAAPAVAEGSGLYGGRFELGEVVGGGATGEVHRGRDTKTGAEVAIKLVSPQVVSSPALTQRVERELKLLEKVDNPAVAKVIASGKQGDRVWVASEWIEGGVRIDHILAQGVEAERASELVLAIGGALVEAAKVGVVHRDLAPKNVLFGNGVVKLINFPLAEPHERVSGVPGFVSPEAIEGKPIDQRSTTYSLGALYYYLLTGEAPFAGEDSAVHAAQLSGNAVPPSQKAAVPADIDSLVGRAMERNPAKRYLTLRQFLDDIEKVKRGPEGGLGSTAPFGRAGKKPRELAQTMLGLGPMPGSEAKTRQMDIQIPPEALREAEALEAVWSGTPAAGAAAAPAPAPGVPPGFSTQPGGHGGSQLPVSGQVVQVTQPMPPMPSPQPAVQVAQAQPQAYPVVTAPAQAQPAVVHQPAPAAQQAYAEPAAASPWSAPQQAQAAAQAAAQASAAQAQAAVQAAAAMEATAPVTAMPRSSAQASAASAPQSSQAKGPAAQVAQTSQAKVAPAAVSPASSHAGGKKKPEAKDKKAKGKFRETMWFKKGDLDAAAAEAAAAAKDGSVQDKADSLPMEERYSDDGSITSTDAARYSLKTGNTSSMPAMRDGDAGTSVSERELIGEMKGGRKTIFLLIGLGVVAVVAVVLIFALR